MTRIPSRRTLPRSDSDPTAGIPGRRRTARRAAALAFALATLLAAPLGAQVIRGTVAEADGSPLQGALVSALDPGGARRMAGLTDAAGRFELRMPRAGRYTLRAERVGYASTVSGPVEVAEGETVERRLTAAPSPLQLEGLTVTPDERRCRTDPAQGTRVAALWEEARKALESSAWAQEAGRFRFEVTDFSRELDPQDQRVRRSLEEPRAVVTSHPYAAFSADSLVESGFIRPRGTDLFYHAPDAQVLLSDAFMATHCFALREPPAGQDSLVGLAFEPVRRRRQTDVRGVLWIDRATAELRHLDFQYTHVPFGISPERLAGRVEFRRLPTGAWVVSRWALRMPAVEVAPGRGTAAALGLDERPRLLAIVERGGEVTRVLGTDGTPLAEAASAAVEGTVWDSTRAAPLAGARVFVSGTAHSATTDSAGRFRIAGVLPGTYTLGFSHPRLDSLETVGAAPAPVAVAPGAAARAELAVPSLRTLFAVACPAGDAGVVAGRVMDAGTGRPLAGARVTVSWPRAGAAQAGSLRAVADSAGRYAVCGVPAGAAASARAEFDTRSSLAAAVRTTGAGDVAVRDLSVAGRVASGEAVALDPVTAVSRGTARMAEVRARMARGVGRFITREDIERRRPSRFTDLFEMIPSVQLVPSSLTGDGGNSELVVTIRGVRPLMNGQICSVAFYIDGIPFNPSPRSAAGGGTPQPAGTFGTSDEPTAGLIAAQVDVDQVEAVEVYRPGTEPAQYSRTDRGCGTVLIWTRADPGARRPPAGGRN